MLLLQDCNLQTYWLWPWEVVEEEEEQEEAEDGDRGSRPETRSNRVHGGSAAEFDDSKGKGCCFLIKWRHDSYL